jgi:hypothetical protein
VFRKKVVVRLTRILALVFGVIVLFAVSSAWLVDGLWSIRTVAPVKTTTSSECVRRAIHRLPEFTVTTDPGVPAGWVHATLLVDGAHFGIDVSPLTEATFQIRTYGRQSLYLQPWRTSRIRETVNKLVSIVVQECGSVPG